MSKAYEIIGGKAYDTMLYPSSIVKDGVSVPDQEGQFEIIEGAAYPILRFDTIPFAGRISGGDMVFQFGISDQLLTSSPVIVCLGSSTMYGHGLSSPNRLADRLNAWLDINATDATLTNLAVEGYSLANLRTTANGGTAGHNIEAACELNPTFIFVDEPTNWAGAYDVATQIAYMLEIFSYAWARGIMVLFSGSRPRTPYSGTQDSRLVDLNPALLAHPILKYVSNVNFNDFLKDGTVADLRTDYDQGDGIHINASGIVALANNIIAFWQRVLRVVTAFNRYEIEKSDDGSTGWALSQTITDMTLNHLTVTAETGYYRCRARLKDGSYIDYSNVSHIEVAATNPTADAGSDKSLAAGTSTVDITGGGTAHNGATITGYAWAVISGLASLENEDTATVTVTGLSDGNSCTLRLTVTDSNGLTGSDDVVVSVAAPSVIEAKFNMNATAQNVLDWVDVSGNPYAAEITSDVYPGTDIYIQTVRLNEASQNVWGMTNGDSSNNNVGKTTGNNTGAFPDLILVSNHFTTGQAYTAGNEQYKICGLDPERLYTIKVMGDRITTPPRLMDWNLVDDNGLETVEDFDVANNTATLVIFTNKKPSSDGIIKLAINKPTPNNASHQFGYCNALTIKPE